MKLQVLVDNNTFIDCYYLGEPGASYYIEDGSAKILFDTGYSNIFIKNAQDMGIDLGAITHIVLSHGHNDHTGGLKALVECFDLSQTRLIAHPLCFAPKWAHEGYIGAPFDTAQVMGKFSCTLTREPYWITENCCFLGEIPESNDFETRRKLGEMDVDGRRVDDFLLDDTAMAVRTGEGIFIITGCSHSGICNIVEQAKKVFHTEKIAGIIGGFHLFKTDGRLERTIDYLSGLAASHMYPCHCVSLKAKAEMMKRMDVEEVGVGLALEQPPAFSSSD